LAGQPLFHARFAAPGSLIVRRAQVFDSALVKNKRGPAVEREPDPAPIRTRGSVRHAIVSRAGSVPRSGLRQKRIGVRPLSSNRTPPKPHTRFGETRNDECRKKCAEIIFANDFAEMRNLHYRARF
jgi:hypothetical protein